MRPITLTPPGTAIAPSELILNPDGSIYHLALRPEDLGDIVFVVGDPGRVEKISKRFDRIDHRSQNREFVAHTGMLNNRRITALATGIGPDNIDIVLNELDALVNIDLATRSPKAQQKALTIIRLGTCGALQEDIPVDEFVVSHSALGLDAMMHYYAYEQTDAELRLLNAFLEHTDWPGNLPVPYIASGDAQLLEALGPDNHVGITATAGGFYGPQGRQLRAVPAVPDINESFTSFVFPRSAPANDLRIMNYEMETSALYGLSGVLGHRACTVCAVVANRLRKEYTKDHHSAVDRMIDMVLERVAG